MQTRQSVFMVVEGLRDGGEDLKAERLPQVDRNAVLVSTTALNCILR